ncbi:MAG: pyridoxamine 5'-phosphate oxidase family protein [Anaerolineae bacterium]|nr:pyridoxamine 5'-phosphate oxidase family protein [Anaerolineae bacterium]
MTTYAQHVPAAERTLRLLETLAAAPEGFLAGELIESLQISRSSLFALLNTLKTYHYVEQSDERGRYRAGPALYALTPAKHRGLAALIETFHTDPEFSAFTETLALARLDGDNTIIIAQQESRQPVRVVLEIGRRRPAADTAAGLVLLAGLPTDAVQRALIPSTSGLTDTLDQIRQTGMAQTHHNEMVEVASPVCADGYQPIAALQLNIPAFRWQNNNDLNQSLRLAAGRLSYRLGAPVYQPYGQTQPELVGPTRPLDANEINQFLQQAWGARLACTRKNGTPHVVPLWYEWDGQFFWVTASANASWGHYLRENTSVSLTVDEPWPPLRRVLVTGSAQPVADNTLAGGVAGLRERLVTRYLGQGANPTAMQQMQWQAFRITPQKIIGQRGLGG